MALSTDILGWWKGENDNLDSSTYGNDAIDINGSPSYATGLVGDAFNLATPHYLEVPLSPSINTFTNFTFECWLNYPSNALTHKFFAKQTDGGFILVDFESRQNGANTCSWVMNLATDGGSSSDLNGSTITIPTSTWIHVAGSYDGSNVKFYQDGSLIDTIPFAGGNLISSTTKNGEILKSYTGLLDEPSLWSRALTDDEILAIYNAGPAGKYNLPFVNPSAPSGPVLSIPIRPNISMNNGGIIRKPSDPFTSMEINDNRGVITDTIPALASGKKVLSKVIYKKNGIIE